MQTFEHWIVERDAHAPATYCRQRLAAYLRDRDERLSGLIDFGAADATTNLTEGAAERIGERIKGRLRRSAPRTGAPAIPDAEEAVMSWADC